MAGRADKQLATLLNLCNAGNILDAEWSNITGLIEDYFLFNQVKEDWPEPDSEEMENVQTQDVCDIETEKEDIVEEAVVHIEGAVGYNCDEIYCNGAPAEMHLNAWNVLSVCIIYNIAWRSQQLLKSLGIPHTAWFHELP